MSKLPKIKNVWRDVDYVHKLNQEEKQWLYNFQLEYVFGITTNKELRNEAAKRFYAQRSDVMNTPTDKIILHHVNRNRKNKRIPDLKASIEEQSEELFATYEEKLNDDLDNNNNSNNNPTLCNLSNKK